MSAGGHISAMMATIKNNSQRKNKPSFIPRFEKKYTKGDAIHSKDLSPEDKVKLLAQLKVNRKREEKLRTYKLMISLGVTVIVIGIIVFTLKAVYL